MKDTLTMPDFSKTVYIFGKNKKGFTEMYEVEGQPTKEQWNNMCEKINAFTWSHNAWFWNE